MRQIDVHEMSDKAAFNGFHRLVLAWCALIIIFDGYDLAVVGIALPSIMKDMGVDAASAGFMVSAALFGMMFGNIFFGTLADKIGRRHVIVICLALFSLFTAAAGFTRDPITFSISRFIAGVGIGGVMPIVVAQMTEPIGGGWLADRFRIKYVLAAMYLLAAVSITLLGYKVPTGVLFLLIGLAGASTIGTQIVSLAYTGQFYPMAVRSTGIGWALGIGRIGAIMAPIVIGVLVGLSLPLQQNFMAIAVPGLLAALAILLVDDRRNASTHHRPVGAGSGEPVIAGSNQAAGAGAKGSSWGLAGTAQANRDRP